MHATSTTPLSTGQFPDAPSADLVRARARYEDDRRHWRAVSRRVRRLVNGFGVVVLTAMMIEIGLPSPDRQVTLERVPSPDVSVQTGR